MQRITNSIMVSNLIQTLSERMRTLSDLQTQLATGKSVNYASDDPAAAGIILQLQNSLVQNSQFQENVQNAMSWLMNTESTLQNLNDLLTEVRAIAVEGGNEALGPENMAILADEVNSYLDSLYALANSDYSGKSIFGGTNTTEQAFSATYDPATGWITAVTANPDGIDGSMMRQVDTYQIMQINVGGTDLFIPNGAGGSEDVFQVLINLRDALQAGDPTAVGDMIPAIDIVKENVLDFSTFAGTKVTQLQNLENSLLTEETQLTSNLSNKEDADLVELMTQMMLEQNAYQVALSMGAGIIQQSLVNFL